MQIVRSPQRGCLKPEIRYRPLEACIFVFSTSLEPAHRFCFFAKVRCPGQESSATKSPYALRLPELMLRMLELAGMLVAGQEYLQILVTKMVPLDFAPPANPQALDPKPFIA